MRASRPATLVSTVDISDLGHCPELSFQLVHGHTGQILAAKRSYCLRCETRNGKTILITFLEVEDIGSPCGSVPLWCRSCHGDTVGHGINAPDPSHPPALATARTP